MRKFFKKDKEENDGFDIVTDIKEPFSFANFFEIQVMERARRFKALLAEKGILFFLTSPFQARSRLIAQMLILFIGILFGVVPRASSLMSELRNQAYVSEIHGLKQKTVGSIDYIIPAASSYYKRMHILAFVMRGENLPSSASQYEVHLANSYGASDWSSVIYSWNVLPVNDEERILLVGIDQSKQESGYGAFDLFIQIAGEEIEDYTKTPFEITLSTAQETTKLYDKNGIHLSAITEALCGTGTISKNQDTFKEALEKYKVALEQVEAMPIDITVSPTVEELEATCLYNRVYRSLTDTSTTNDIVDITSLDALPEFDTEITLTSSDFPYTKDVVSGIEKNENQSDEDKIIIDAFNRMESAKTSVISAMQGVNGAAMNWYNSLAKCKLVLNQTVTIDSFPYFAQCTATIEDEIKYVKDVKSDQSSESDETTETETEFSEDNISETTSPADEENSPDVTSDNDPTVNGQ